MSHLEITTLGAFQTKMDGKILNTFRTDKVRALLVFLAVEAFRTHRREALASMFWPDRLEAASLNNLRQALYRLRNALGKHDTDSQFLLATANEIQFNVRGNYALDVKQFNDHLAVYHSHHPGGRSVCDDCLIRLRRSVMLYGGDFMAGFSLPGCPQFDWWLLSQQEFYHRQMLEVLDYLGTFYESSRDYIQAAFYAQREIELEPWRETAHRRRMRALAFSDQRGEALRQYERCRGILAEEMGIEPSKSTTDLYQIIRLGETLEPRDGGQLKAGYSMLPMEPVKISASAVRFVGFEKELDQLNGHLASALSGRARVVLISGEAGSGKTTLLSEFIRRALRKHGDLLAAAGSCGVQYGYGDPYLPFRQALQILAGDPGGISLEGTTDGEYARRIWAAYPIVLAAMLDQGADLVGTFLPVAALIRQAYWLEDGRAEFLARLEVRDRHRTGEETASDTPSGHTAFFDQFTRVVLAITRRYPLILALDDLQWADHGTLSLIFHLARNLGDAPVLLLCSYRPEEISFERGGERHPIQSLANELLAQFGEIRLDLTNATGLDFVSAFLDSEPNKLDADFRQELFQLTEGHPLFTVELLRGLQDSGGLVRDEEGYWIAGRNLDWELIPARVEAVITERLARPPAECRAILEAASIQGETFSAEILATVLAKSEKRIIERLSNELCRQHRLVTPEGLQRLGGTTHSRYRFRHNLYQRQLYLNLDPVVRARYHQTMAETLEQSYLQDGGGDTRSLVNAPQLALHFEKAGLVGKAAYFHRESGDKAYRLAASEDAIGHYQRGLELLSNLPESGEKIHQELMFLFSLIAALNASRGYAMPELLRVLARADELAVKSGNIELVAMSLYLKGCYQFARAEYQETIETGTKLRKLFSEEPVPWISNLADVLIGVCRLNLGELALARDYLGKITIAKDSGQVSVPQSPAGRLNLVYPVFIAWDLWLLGFPDQAASLSEQLLASVQKSGYPYPLAFTLGYGNCFIHAFRGEMKELEHRARELVELSDKYGYGINRALGLFFSGRAQIDRGEIEAGLANMQNGMAGYLELAHISLQTILLGIQAEAYLATGQNKEALECLSEAFRVSAESNERVYLAELLRLQGEALLQFGGEQEKAERCLVEALQVARDQEGRALELRTATSLARLWRMQGKIEQAAKTLGEVYTWFSEGFETLDLRKAACLLIELESDRAIPEKW